MNGQDLANWAATRVADAVVAIALFSILAAMAIFWAAISSVTIESECRDACLIGGYERHVVLDGDCYCGEPGEPMHRAVSR